MVSSQSRNSFWSHRICRKMITTCRSAEDLKVMREQTYAEDWSLMPDKWAQLLNDEYDLRMSTLQENAA